MNAAEKIKKLFVKSNVTVSRKLDDKIKTTMLQTFEKTKNKEPAIEPNIWRIIMRSTITKLATAAVIIIAAVAGITLLEKTTTPAYAIEQTTEALKRVSTVHIIGQDWEGHPFQTWIKTNPVTGASDYVCIDQTPYGLKISSTPQGSCVWDNSGNIFRKTNKILACFDARFEYMFEDIVKKIGSIEKDECIKIYTEKDPENGEDVITIWAITKTQESKIYIDPNTKLPIRIYFERADNMAQILKSADHIYYNEQVPDGIFDFTIPKECFEPEYTPFSDPNNGMNSVGLTQEEASIKAAEEYWKAMIRNDWEYVHKLRPLYDAEFWKNGQSKNPPTEIVKIGEPYIKRGCTGLLVPCIIRFQDNKVFEIVLVVEHHKVDNYSFCVIPATWGQITEIK